MVRFKRATLCLLDSPKKQGVAKGVAPKAMPIRMLEEVITPTTKETIGNVKNPTKDEHEGDNDGWKDGDSDMDFGPLARVSIIRSSGFLCELTKSAVLFSSIHDERISL